jgi:hypothetical protein
MHAQKLSWSCLISCLLVVFDPASALAQRNEVFVLVSNHFPYYWNSYVGVERGFFADENLDVKIVTMGSAELSLKGIMGEVAKLLLPTPLVPYWPSDKECRLLSSEVSSKSPYMNLLQRRASRALRI